MKKIWLFALLTIIASVSFTKAAYVDEYPSAYKWAFQNWITTQPTIDKADMEWQITRIALSKMISNYATNLLKKKVDTSKKCQFSDVSDKLNKDYDFWATRACQLWLMWQWITEFRPYDNVTRAEFGTILSRLLWWNKYDGWTPYYKKHINQLNIRWIMTNIKNLEKAKESRGNVMVMLKRSEIFWDIEIPSFEELDDATNIKCHHKAEFWGQEDEDIYLTKWDFILPYKDWYFWFSYLWQDGLWLYIYYRLTKNPCVTYLNSDEILWWPARGQDMNKIYKYYDNNVIAKELNCKIWNHEWCYKEAEKYAYNLLVWNETNEYFSLRMDTLKRIIDNKEFDNNNNENGYSIDRSKRYRNCVDEYKAKYDVKSDNLALNPISDIEKQIGEQYSCKLKKIKNFCAYKYIGACPDWNNCENLGNEINNCDNIIVSTSKTTDERFPGYNVIYWWEWYHNIIGEKTVYYDNKFWISFKLWKEFDWWTIHDEYRKLDSFERPRHLIFFYKKCPSCWNEELWREWYDLVFIVQVFDNDDVSGGNSPYDVDMTLIWKNNKYYFMGTKKSKYVDLNIFNIN